MAVFEPTEEEKAAASYLDWDDAELGKFTKYCALTWEKNCEDAEGLHKVAAASCAMILISQMVACNAETLELKLDGHRRKGIPTGDWVLTIQRNEHP